ncbi:NAD-P-binding protein [Trametes versicolor FP-101664 SS1]|uniref:NAD-P-binding protein n=1 Tax=Trametes versicolor (strain FP-101664) TaxID=717944 RepID=UPI0004624446|nr:NAD-P-binding protein [Trametes versicolor FP-101664 SS1]EIW55885.1 NAD-P-binding protein [Trametes versicolor FP-101664 SS1]
MSSDKSALPVVLVVGATGATGGSIVKGLLASGNFRVAALVRPASQSKPATQALRTSGVDIRIGDLTDGVAKLTEALAGVDVVISAVVAWSILAQKDLIRAAKEVGVKRIVPCDFGTPGKRGVRELTDEKLAIRDFIKELGVPHTFIDVGWWMQITLPLPTRSKVRDDWKAMTYAVYGSGDHKMLVTDLRDIGVFVARIVADPRTLGHAVLAWEDEVTQLEAHEIGERASGEAEVLKAKRFNVPAEAILKYAAEGKAELEKDPSSFAAHAKQSQSEYMYSMHILGENTLENAKALGYLDARELYPDLPKHTLEEFAKEYYGLEEPGKEYLVISD